MIADTARLMVELSMSDNLSGPANRAKAEVASLGQAGSTTAGHMGILGKAAGGAGDAFNHLKGRVSELGSGLLALGGVGGLLGVGAVLESSIHKVEDFGAALEKVTTLTGESAAASGALILEFQKFGMGADRVTQIVGFTEKTLGKLAETMTGKGKDAVSKLTALDEQYGLSLVDSTGKVASFSSVLDQLAGFYDSSASASEKAYVASQVFGRGYTAMIPILNEGSAGLRDAAASAAALGLNSADTVDQLAKFHDQMHLLESQVNVLQLSIGTALLPDLIDLSKAATDFVSGHRADIAAFFRNAAAAGRQAVAVIGQMVGTLSSAWGSVPPELRDFLVKGLVADRTVKFLFGFSPVGSIISGLEGALTKSVGQGLAAAGLGKLFVQPVFVTNPGFGGGGPNLPIGEGAGVGAAVEGLGLGGTLSVAASLAAIAAIPVAYNLLYALRDQNSPGEGNVRNATSGQTVSVQQTLGATGMSDAQFRQLYAYGPMGNLLDQAAFAKTPSAPDRGYEVDNQFRTFMGKAADDLAQGADAWKRAAELAAQQLAGNKLKAAISDLEGALGRVKRNEKGRTGSLLENSHFVEKMLSDADRIARSNESADRKQADLKALQQKLIARGDTWGASQVAKLSQIAAKKTSLSVTVPVNVTTNVSVSSVNQSQSHIVRNTGMHGVVAV